MNARTAQLAFVQRLSATPRGARLARLLAVAQFHDWGVPSEDAELVVAELAANAVFHGRVPGRDFELGLFLDGDVLRIEVTDTRHDRRPPASTSPRPAPDGESGRGLLIVDALAERWGVSDGQVPRKTIWAELRAAPRSQGPYFDKS
ncbi:ATP-binding protein [Streptomyces sp. NBC_01304]|uniref:ATP-binding protein n=1 Tax=Streptomyces sp. NBC_01304 TaxID=2903818 RepID=UPI002E0F7880|nr:ATP-binding protein [Streptomyces sp. NBC_01304]